MDKSIALLYILSFLVASCITVPLPRLIQAVASGDDWPMFRHDPAHTGYSTSTVLASSSKTWKYNTNYPAVSSPTVADGYVYIKGLHLTCINASTGARVWESPEYAGQEISSPAVVDGYLYAGASLYAEYGGDVYALNASTGDRIWSYPTGDFVQSSPAVADGVVYIGSDNGNIYAINAKTGAKSWNYSTGGPVRSSPTVVNGIVYVGSEDGNVYALNASTHEKIWDYTTGGIGFLSYAPSPAFANGIVYIGSRDRNVYALNASTGAKIWNYSTGGEVFGSAAVTNGRVYVSGGFNVYALDASTGTKIWNFTTGGYNPSSPAVANDIVYINSFDYNVYALNASTGAKKGNFTLFPALGPEYSFRVSSPAVAGGMVYVGIDHALYALDASSFVSTPPPKPNGSPLPDGTQPEPFPTVAVIAVSAAVGAVVVATVLAYNKKRKQQH